VEAEVLVTRRTLLGFSGCQWLVIAAGGSSRSLTGILARVALAPLVAAILARWVMRKTRGRALPS
jgi:hypothetical protein